MRSLKSFSIWIILLVFVSLASFSCKRGGPAGPEIPPVACSPTPDMVYFTGDLITVQSCIFEITLKSIATMDIIDKYPARKGMYLLPEVNVKNIAAAIGDNATMWYISYKLFYVEDGDGTRYYQDDVNYRSQIYAFFPGLFTNAYCAMYNTGQQTGYRKLIFDVPKDAKDLVLTFHSTESNNIIKFHLGI